MLHEYPSRVSIKQPPAVYGWIFNLSFMHNNGKISCPTRSIYKKKVVLLL